ncbi:hypothetical protein M885DRAFT_619480, partial [Pelagophyceae sp. CCMP2097]
GRPGPASGCDEDDGGRRAARIRARRRRRADRGPRARAHALPRGPARAACAPARVRHCRRPLPRRHRRRRRGRTRSRRRTRRRVRRPGGRARHVEAVPVPSAQPPRLDWLLDDRLPRLQGVACPGGRRGAIGPGHRGQAQQAAQGRRAQGGQGRRRQEDRLTPAHGDSGDPAGGTAAARAALLAPPAILTRVV